MAERVIVLIGTKKGLFVAEAAKARRRFALRGPHGPGVAVYAALIDRRGSPRLYASSCNPFFGMKVLRSTDLGLKFQETKAAPAFRAASFNASRSMFFSSGPFARRRSRPSPVLSPTVMLIFSPRRFRVILRPSSSVTLIPLM